MHSHQIGNLYRFIVLSFFYLSSKFSALLVTASYDTTVILWSTITGEMIKKYAHKIPLPSRIYAGGDNGAFVRSIGITKNNEFLVTACDDK